MENNKLYDIIIIGAGVAGMTAALYAARSGKTVALIDKDGFGGNIALSPKVENIPGFESISGADFAVNMYNQVMGTSRIDHMITEAKYVEYYKGLIKVTTDENLVCSRTIIFATGSKPREISLDTKNVYYCVTCDGPQFKDKDVIVLGSGNSGATYALELSTYCRKVYICDITNEMCCEQTLKNKINDTSNIVWKPNCTISSVANKYNKLSSVKLSTNEVIFCNGIFVAAGLIPQTELAKNFFTVADNKCLVTNDSLASDKAPNIFAAGDCRDNGVKQVVTACADGARAALSAIKFLNT